MSSLKWAPLGVLTALILTLAACGQRQNSNQNVNIYLPTSPSSGNSQCNDNLNNDPQEDQLIDAADPGCHWDGNAGNPASYDPNDNDERNSGPGTASAGAPGGFALHSGSCENGTAVLTWNASTNADWFEFEHQTWTTGTRARIPNVRVAGNVRTIRLPANTGANNYWNVVAGNAHGTTRSSLPDGYRADVDGMRFVCAAPASAPAPTPPPTGGTPPPTGGTPTPTPGTPTPTPTTPGATCTSGMNFSPFGGTGAQFSNMQLTPAAGCTGVFRSSAPNKVSVTSSGHITFLNPGEAAITFNNGAPAVFKTQ